MSAADVYVDMGFDAALAAAAPADVSQGVPWLLLRSTMESLPKRFCTGTTGKTFINSRIEFEGAEWKVIEYDPETLFARIETGDDRRWVSVCDPNIIWRAERHDPPARLEPLESHEVFTLPPARLSSACLPETLRVELKARGEIPYPTLLRTHDWSITMSHGDYRKWLSILRLTNRRDTETRWTPSFPRPVSVTWPRVQRRRYEIKTKLMLYCMLENNCMHHMEVLRGDAEQVRAQLASRRHGPTMLQLRDDFWKARDIMGDELRAWNNACAPSIVVRALRHVDDDTVEIVICGLHWLFQPRQRPRHDVMVAANLANVFECCFPRPQLHEPNLDAAPPDHLLEEQKRVWEFLLRTETREVQPGWQTHRDANGLVWSQAMDGDMQRGYAPPQSGGVLASSHGSGKRMLLALLCARRNLSTVVLVKSKAQIGVWQRAFRTWTTLAVQGVCGRRAVIDEDADVHITTYDSCRRASHKKWSRVIVADAELVKRGRGRRHDLLQDLEYRHMWLVTTANTKYHAFKDLLGVKGAGSAFWSPFINIDRHLSRVDEVKHIVTLSREHRAMIGQFNQQHGNDKSRYILKHAERLYTDLAAVPPVLFGRVFSSAACHPLPADEVQGVLAERVAASCPVCMEPIRHACVTECDHVFCGSCLRRTRQDTLACPLCRHESTTYRRVTDLPSDELYYNETLRKWIHLDDDTFRTYEVACEDDPMRTSIDYARTLEGPALVLTSSNAVANAFDDVTTYKAFLADQIADETLHVVHTDPSVPVKKIRARMRTFDDTKRTLHSITFT